MGVEMNFWLWVCDVENYPNLWSEWKKRSVASLGWHPDWVKDDPTETRKLERNMNLVSRMKPGDKIVAHLKRSKIGGIGIFQSGVDSEEWEPIARDHDGGFADEHGRLASVRWDVLPEDGKYAMAPEGTIPRRTGTIRRIADRRVFDLIMNAVSDPDSWENLPDSEFLAKNEKEDLHPLIENNIEKIEHGLMANPWGPLHEFPAMPIGFIDFLCVDASGRPVVIEAKRLAADDKSIGQICRYMSWVHLRLRGTKGVRGILVAGELVPAVRFAAASIPGLELFRYKKDGNEIWFERVPNKSEEGPLSRAVLQ
ncbi:MAG: DUF91 domain-containing protein [Thermoplasmata archaeon]|nr:DUF91 domain-containing protein [Thermoplasmata archaeon]